MPDDAMERLLKAECPYLMTVPNWWNGAPEKKCGLGGPCLPGTRHQCPSKEVQPHA